MYQKELETVTKTFLDLFVEKYKIDTKTVQCIRTYGWDKEAVVRVEYFVLRTQYKYADFYKDYKPTVLAKKYLREKYGYFPKNLNFNNPHYDRIGCSVLFVYDVSKEDFDKYSSLPTVDYSSFNDEENCGTIEFLIHNEKQCELCYNQRLYEYYK